MPNHLLSIRTALAIGVLVGASVHATQQTPAGSAITVFEGARVIVGDGSAPIDNAVFLVEGSRFGQVGRAGQVKIPAGATRVNLAGKTVMPALIDTHTHMSSTTRDALVDHLRNKARFGSAVVMSLGTDPGDVAFQVRAETVPGGAKLLTAGRGITMPEPGRTDVPYWITSAAEARKAVQELAAKKVDFVKIWVDDRDGKYKKLTPELYGAVIDEAHKHGLRVTAHIFALDDAKGLLKAGVDAFAHGVRDRDIDDEFVAMMKQRPNVFLVPNLPDRGVKTDMSWLRGAISDDELKKVQAGAVDRPQAQAAFAIQARNLAKLNAAGVKIALGTDGGIAWSPHLEMADMVAAGMTPHQVIVAATRNAAELLRLKEHGTMAAGKSADFLVLDGNPLDDITNTRKISAVYLRGAAQARSASPPTGATDITHAEFTTVLKSMNPDGVSDQQIKVVDIGSYNIAVGILHRSGKAKQNAIAHSEITEVYYVIDGAGTFVTGGSMTGATPADPNGNTVKVLVGPSTNGATLANGQSRRIGPGDVIIVPPGVGHWFSAIEKDLDYLVFRVDPTHVLPAGYVHPLLKK